ncbi:MAG: hypothetical protein ACK43K_10365 [Chitinophagales bacterium]
MKQKYCVLLFSMFIFNQYWSQEAHQMISMYKMKLFDEKKLTPFLSVKMTLEISTKDGKFPATLWLMENMIYKLEMQEKNGKSIEFIDPSKYLLFSSDMKEKKQSEANSELHFRKKIWLNFYPFLHNKAESPITEVQLGMDMNGGVSVATATVDEPTKPVQEEADLSIKKYVQFLPFNDMSHSFYYDMKNSMVSKIETRYFENGIEKKEVVIYGKTLLSPQGYHYPESFTTVFGEATVKSIQFNPKINSSELEVKF